MPPSNCTNGHQKAKKVGNQTVGFFSERAPLLAPDIQNHPFGWFFVLNSWCACRMIDAMKCFRVAFLLAVLVPMFGASGAPTDAAAPGQGGATEITMTTTQAIQMAGRLVNNGDYEHAYQMLTMMPDTGNGELETERWFLLAQIASRRGDIDGAIRIYQKILDARPDAARVRFELALCYMHQGRWSRADYHLRLAMAGDDLSDDAKRMMNYYRYVVRQNKNWNVYFNFGVYGEPSVYWTRYDDGLYTAHNGALTKITAHDFTHRYSLSVSNNKLDVWGFVPTLTVSYTQRDSNLWQREFKKTAIEFTMMQRF